MIKLAGIIMLGILAQWLAWRIDPPGALVAVLVFEFIRSSEGGAAFTSHALIPFFRSS